MFPWGDNPFVDIFSKFFQHLSLLFFLGFFHFAIWYQNLPEYHPLFSRAEAPIPVVPKSRNSRCRPSVSPKPGFLKRPAGATVSRRRGDLWVVKRLRPLVSAASQLLAAIRRVSWKPLLGSATGLEARLAPGQDGDGRVRRRN